MNDKDWRVVYASILNFELLGANLLWDDHRGLALWMCIAAFSTLIGLLTRGL